MLVTSETNSGPPSRTPSILDSPTLARVERARLRLEASTTNGNVENSLERKILDPKVSTPYLFIYYWKLFKSKIYFCFNQLLLISIRKGQILNWFEFLLFYFLILCYSVNLLCSFWSRQFETNRICFVISCWK